MAGSCGGEEQSSFLPRLSSRSTTRLFSLSIDRKMLALARFRLWEGVMANQGTLSWPMARAVVTRPNDEAIVDGETRFTYAQWSRRVRGITAGLRSLGVRT